MLKKSLPILAAAISCCMISISQGQDYETKDQWAARMQSDHVITRHLCNPQGHLITCTSEYNEDVNGQSMKKKIDTASCTEFVDYMTAAMLHDGKSDNKPAMFYHKLPANISAGYQMDHFASDLGKNISGQIYGVLQQKGGVILRNDECDKKLMEQANINGN